MFRQHLISAIAIGTFLTFSAGLSAQPATGGNSPVALPNVLPQETSSETDTTYGMKQLSPAAEKQAFINRQQDRESELAQGSFKWIPWTQADEKIRQFVAERDPKGTRVSDNPKYWDFAVYDVDHDMAPDVVMTYWMDCVAAGCQNVVFFGDPKLKPVFIIGMIIKPYKRGLWVDGNYVEF